MLRTVEVRPIGTQPGPWPGGAPVPCYPHSVEAREFLRVRIVSNLSPRQAAAALETDVATVLALEEGSRALGCAGCWADAFRRLERAARPPAPAARA